MLPPKNKLSDENNSATTSSCPQSRAVRPRIPYENQRLQKIVKIVIILVILAKLRRYLNASRAHYA
jgi:hypothetical protein